MTVPLAPPAARSPYTAADPPLGSTAPETGDAAARYTVSLARDPAEVRAAQRLRHEVFAQEFGARLDGPEPEPDADAFDAHCDLLLIRESATGSVVGTYRLLEVGRSCVHPDHRDGAVIALMWARIARYLTDSGHNWLAGCCSVPLADGGRTAAGVRRRVLERHLAPEAHRVTPHRPWQPPADVEPLGRADLPPLLRGYLRLGARVCGEPAHEPEFGVADFYVLLSLRDIGPRYLRHFLSLDPA